MDLTVLALAKNFTKETVKGMGALKGASCTISSVNEVENGTEITFRYEDNTGAEHFETIFVKNGKDGVGKIDDDAIEGSINAISSGAVYRLLGNSEQLIAEIYEIVGGIT